ncbi:DUF859 family phage minor structural protein [Anaerococcus hydrogenalis]|uniref:Conserved domain protein n=1 Tax=Anaerococcus hydrogenalis ACS-025-V-Sch4 TaxID=879306 RepID=F0H1M9_9FIRM|nr:DUF859 family phage minor structural protein [Anaerococcus hydrogenalis]EGC83581.1 conserved domain protein [Anaerococcus hydrogenalis ACS-025-V-Sch4]
MATYSKTLNNGWGTLNLELRQESQNIGNNTSTVYYKLYIKGQGGYGFWNKYHTGKTSVVINGYTVHSQTGRDFDINNGGTQQLASGTTTIKHNEDGSKSFSFSASLWSTSATGYVSGNFSLSKIPRASSFSLQNSSGTNISSIYAGNDVKISIDKKVSSFTHSVKVSCSGNSETISNKTSSSSITWSNSNNVMTSYMQNLKSMNLTFTLETYDGNTRIGSSSKNLTLNVPSSAGPSISSVEITEANQNKINIIGSSPFYQHLTDLRIKTSGFGEYGASIKSVNVSIGSYNISGQDAIIKDINLTGSQSVKITVSDSRDMSASTIRTINLNPYNLPNISFFNAYRNQSNTKYASARIALTATVIDNKNPLDVKVDVAEKDSNSWKNVYAATVGNGKFNNTISLGGGFDDYKAYDVRLSIADKFKRHQALSTIPATSQSLVIGANKPVVGIGKVPTIDKGLEIEGLFKMGDFTTSISGNDIVFKNNKANGSIKFENNLQLEGDIKFPTGNDKKIINLALENGLTGYIKARKDPFGGVNVWGEVTIKDDNVRKKWSTWATLPSGYLPKSLLPFDMYSSKSGYGSYMVQGMAVTEKGNITYIGINWDQNEPGNGWYNYFNLYFKPEAAW